MGTPPRPAPRAAVRRLRPGPEGPTSIEEAYGFERRARPERPWIGVCMVTSLDGSVVAGGRSGTLSSPNDHQVLQTLRSVADVVIVGAGTVRAERYGPPKRSQLRIGVVTSSGAVDLDTDLFRSGSGFLIAPRSAPIDADAVDVVRAGETALDLATAIVGLGELVPDLSFVLAEGGPHLNASLLAAGLVDELDLSLSPRMVGGPGGRMTAGGPETDTAYDLAHLLVDDDGFLFSRWVRR